MILNIPASIKMSAIWRKQNRHDTQGKEKRISTHTHTHTYARTRLHGRESLVHEE